MMKLKMDSQYKKNQQNQELTAWNTIKSTDLEVK